MIAVELTTDLPTLSAMGMVDIDATALVSAGIFVVMMVVLNKLLFQPYLAIVHERAAMTTGAADTAAATSQKADAVLADYQSKLAAARAEASAKRDELRASGAAEESRIVTAAREQAASALAEKRAGLAVQVAKAEQEIEARATELAGAIVGRVLS